MTNHPAAARPVAPVFFSPVQQRQMMRRAANDNAARHGHDPVLRDALKHFARHGLGAAEVARQEAERAFFAGERDSYRHWLAICRTLDRRMAAALEIHDGRTVR